MNYRVVNFRWVTIVLIKGNFKVPRNVWKLGNVVEQVKGRDGNTRGAKLLTVSIIGLQQNCYRPFQKLMHFEIVKNNNVSSNETLMRVTVTMKD